MPTTKMQLNVWSRINRSCEEWCPVPRKFILNGLVYSKSLAVVPKDIIKRMQKMTIPFFWGNKRLKVTQRTLVGLKCDGGFCLTHIQSMIDAYRIKVRLQIISTRKPATWRFYVMINTARKLRRITPQIDIEVSLFHEAAAATVRSLSAGGEPELPPTNYSFY